MKQFFERAAKRTKLTEHVSETQATSKDTCDDRTCVLAGCIVAYSTVCISGSEMYPVEGGGFARLLTPHRTAELRFATTAAATSGAAKRGRSAINPADELRAIAASSAIHFSVAGVEIGKLPADAARCLASLLQRNLASVKASVAASPPVDVERGTGVPLDLQVTLSPSSFAPATSASISTIHSKLLTIPRPAKSGSAKAVVQSAALVDAEKEIRKRAWTSLLQMLGLRKQHDALISVSPGLDSARTPQSKEQTCDEALVPVLEDEGSGEISDETIAQLGRWSALERLDLPQPVFPPEVFASRLRPYQAQAVFWMWQRENPGRDFPSEWIASRSCSSGSETPSSAARQLHTSWEEYVIPAGRDNSKSSALYFRPADGTLSLDFPSSDSEPARGGILADEMGLGKTVTCLALLSTDRAPLLSGKPPIKAPGALGGGTLVVVPLSLMSQWHAECHKHFPRSLVPSVCEYHGTSRSLSSEVVRSYDIVLTTYGMLTSEKETGPLFQMNWHRIMLDEAHIMNNRMSSVALAASRLRSGCRWAITGTPMQNSVDDLYSIVRFLGLEPWNSWPAWQKAVSEPLKRGAVEHALGSAHRIVQPLMIRRTKTTRDAKTGELVIKLPVKRVHTVELDLSSAERDLYDALYQESKTKFDKYIAGGNNPDGYMRILSLITKMRQTICHPVLSLPKGEQDNASLDAIKRKCLDKMVEGSTELGPVVSQMLDYLSSKHVPECVLCFELPPNEPVAASCGHSLCSKCSLQVCKALGGQCPACQRSGLSASSFQALPNTMKFPSCLFPKERGCMPSELQSTKIRKLLVFLQDDFAAGRHAVVFSQWTSFLELVGRALDTEGLKAWRQFDGSMTGAQRNEMVRWFQKEGSSSTGRILLISLKAGAVGLNLVAATRVYLLDIWWNAAAEDQAVQRVHRIGQTQEVDVFKFVVRDSIDANLLMLQSVKAKLTEKALEGGQIDGQASSRASDKMSREDLKMLFAPCRGLGASSHATA